MVLAWPGNGRPHERRTRPPRRTGARGPGAAGPRRLPGAPGTLWGHPAGHRPGDWCLFLHGQSVALRRTVPAGSPPRALRRRPSAAGPGGDDVTHEMVKNLDDLPLVLTV